MAIWNNFVRPISRHFRQARAQVMISLLGKDFPEKKVLDLGGSIHFWQKLDPSLRPKDITLLNVADDSQSEADFDQNELSITLYDGRTIPYPDNHFDIVICNSVIEHVSIEDRENFVSEIKRVSQSYFIQTPAYAFPIEPHFVFPFVHWLPRSIGRSLVPLGLWSILSRPSRQHRQAYFDEVSLLRVKELRSYFPRDLIVTEKFFLLPKSRIVFGSN